MIYIYKYAGDYLIKVRSNEILLDQYNHPQQIYVKDTIKFKITERDLYGNII